MAKKRLTDIQRNVRVFNQEIARKRRDAMANRTVEEIQKEYTQLASEAGDMAYRIKCFEESLAQTYAKMLKLNQDVGARANAGAAKSEEIKNESKAE